VVSAVHANYTILKRCVGEGGDWYQNLVETYNTLGIQKNDAIKLLDRPRNQLLLDLHVARILLRDWLDPDSVFTDEFLIRIDEPNDMQGQLVARVVIDGVIVPDEDYCLLVETFFSALSLEQADRQNGVSFLGGCGDRRCCGESYETGKRELFWNWYIPTYSMLSVEGKSYEPLAVDFRLDWADVLSAGEKIIQEIERLEMRDLHRAKLSEYKTQINELRISNLYSHDGNATE
jgi:hypothetical protein